MPEFIKSKVAEWAFGIAAKKVGVLLAKFLVSLYLSHKVAEQAQAWGVGLTLSPEILQGVILAKIEFLRNWLKVKKGWSWL